MNTNYSKPSSRVERREPCPKCRAGGGDRAGDNLAVYSDGGKHCFACGRHEHADPWVEVERMVREKEAKVELPQVLDFPKDYTPLNDSIFAKNAMSWLRAYGINDGEITQWSIGWSGIHQLLVYPVYDAQNKLVMWQGRSFAPNAPQKYLTFGPKHDIMHLVGRKNSGICVVTEDMVSAIKVGRSYQAMPLWGAEMGLGLIKKLSERFDELGIWLDSNKTKEAVKIALRASQYIPTFVVATPYDPKGYGHDIILSKVEEARKGTIWKEHTQAPADPKREAIEMGYPDREECAQRLRNAIAVAQEKKGAMALAGAPKAAIEPNGSVRLLDANGRDLQLGYTDPHSDRGRVETKPYVNCDGGAACISKDGNQCVYCQEYDREGYIESRVKMKDMYGRDRFLDEVKSFAETAHYPFPYVDSHEYKKDTHGS